MILDFWFFDFMKNDDEIRRSAISSFPGGLNDFEQAKWIAIATSEELKASKMSAYRMGHPRQIVMIEEEQYRRIEGDRHQKVIERLLILEKPHWTTAPGFWIAVGGFLLAGLAAWFAWLAIPRPSPQDVLSPPNSSSSPPLVAPPSLPK